METKQKGLLILGSSGNGHLSDALHGAGFAPIVRETMQEALEQLRHDSFAAVLLDCSHVNEDALEFVLNVRDINEKVWVIVIGGPVDGRTRDTLSSQRNTVFLDASATESHLLRELDRVFRKSGSDWA